MRLGGNMKTLAKDIAALNTKFDIVQWESGDALPTFGPVVGVDTETELFTAMTPFPDMVVLGVYDPANSKCWIVYWYDALPFIQHLNRSGTVQYYFNAAYDVMVMNRLDEECTSYEALEGARLKCLMIRANLYDLATAGFILGKHRSLAACSQALLGITLDKGDPNDPDNSARMTFRRHNADGTRYEITDEQAVYLAYDCFTTYSLIAKIPKQPTEDAHTKGSIVLASITNNGLQVDKLVYNSLVKKLESDRDGYRQDLLSHGFPDPYKEDVLTGDDVDNLLLSSFKSFLEFCCDNVHLPTEAPNKTSIKAILAHMYNYDKDSENVLEMIETVAYLILFPATSLKKAEQSLYDTMCEELGILAFDQSRKKAAMKMLLHLLMDELTAKIKDGTIMETGFDMEAAMANVSAVMDDNPAWWSKVEVIGPKKFQQQHLQGLLDRNPDLDLPVTDKSGEIQLTLNDMWRLTDLGITDSFVEAYTKFNHCQKYLSTYLNSEFIQEDGRIHPKFTNVLRTGRTSCSSPNV